MSGVVTEFSYDEVIKHRVLSQGFVLVLENEKLFEAISKGRVFENHDSADQAASSNTFGFGRYQIVQIFSDVQQEGLLT